jgi:hypothetical protein
LAVLAAVLAAAAHAQTEPGAGKVVFVSGPAHVVGADGKQRPAAAGTEIRQGEQVITGADGYVHLRMVDNGFVAVRPASRLAIELYEYDAAQPAASRIKLQLNAGNTRTVSGKGGEAAKQNYRFNTPMAAIGLRGTDYTVVSSDDATRVSVARGAVAVTPLGEGCSAGTLGPCATPSTRELSAAVRHAYLEVNTKTRTPVLVRPEQDPQGGNGQNPVNRPDEPKAESKGEVQLTESKSPANQVVADRVTAGLVPAEAPAPQLLAWGRWASYASQGDGSPAVATLLGDHSIVVGNDVFGIVRLNGSKLELPARGTVDFKLAGSEAYVVNGGSLTPAGVAGGSLSIDFQRRDFNTTLAVQHGGGLEQLHAGGSVTRQGVLNADASRSNMQMQGALAGAASEAAYVFSKNLTSGGLLGAVRWVR